MRVKLQIFNFNFWFFFAKELLERTRNGCLRSIEIAALTKVNSKSLFQPSWNCQDLKSKPVFEGEKQVKNLSTFRKFSFFPLSPNIL